jgi:hypothetical protein
MTFTIATTPVNSVAALGKSHGQRKETDTHKDWTFIITALDEIICVLSIGMVTFPKMSIVSIGNGTIMIASGWSMARAISPIWRTSGFTTTH